MQTVKRAMVITPPMIPPTMVGVIKFKLFEVGGVEEARGADGNDEGVDLVGGSPEPGLLKTD
jgi:hypothetical protein